MRIDYDLTFGTDNIKYRPASDGALLLTKIANKGSTKLCKGTNTASMTKVFAYGSQAYVPALVWLLDLYLLLCHLQKPNMAKTQY